jgi:hypothetical protein
MPNALIKSAHEESGIPEKKLEAIWTAAITHAKSKNISNPDAYANGAIRYAIKSKAMDSARVIDDNGYLICPNSIITGNDVAQYFGAEIPMYQSLGLDAKKVYSVYRPIQEMQSNNFNGMPLLSRHIMDFDSENQDKDLIIGTIHDCEIIDNDQVSATVTFWDAGAVDELDNGKKYLSAGYWYTPILEAGNFRGQNYDIKMTDIRANHVAHVDNPRYKPAVVGDEDIIQKTQGVVKMKFKNKLINNLYTRLMGKGLDAETIEKIEEEAKAADEAAEKEDKKAADAESDEKDCKATDEHEDEKEDKALIEKTIKEKGLDSDTINKMIADGIAKGVAEATKQMSSQRKAMDSALDAYELLFGKANRMAFDSADAVYDSILKHKGFDTKGKSLEQKAAMVEVLSPAPAKKQIAADSQSVNKSIFETNSVLSKYLK